MTPEPRLRKEEWEVRPVNIGIARRLVERHHYAGGASNTATYLHGLFPADSFWQEECVGAAWWIPPTRSAAEATYPQNWRGHTGGIYRATNWQYVGLTQPLPVWTRNGTMVARKAGPVTRTYGEMEETGAELVGSFPKHKFVHIVEAG